MTVEEHTHVALRLLQDRYQRLIELSSDWYWEQDRQYRFTLINGAATVGDFDGQQHIGRTFWEIDAFTVPAPESWDTFRALLHVRASFSSFLTRYEFSQMDNSYVSISGRPLFDAGGRFIGYCGTAKDVTSPIRDDQLLTMQHTVTQLLANSENMEAGLQAVMRHIGEREQWDCGVFRGIDTQHRQLQWRAPEVAAASAIALATLVDRIIANPDALDRRQTPPTELGGTGKMPSAVRSPAGQSMLDGALWIEDTAHVLVQPADDAGNTRLGTLFAFPVFAAGHRIGIFAFASTAIRRLDNQLLQIIDGIGSQVGQFIQREQAERSIRASEERFRSLTEFSSDWYWEQDAQFRFVDVAGKNVDTNQGFIGKTHWDEYFHTEPVDSTWDKHRQRVSAHETFRDLILKRTQRDGSTIYYSLSGRPFFDDRGVFSGYRGIGKDITEQRRADDRIRYMANHDALTALPNRTMFSQLLNLALSSSRRYQRKLAVIFIDLDRFKLINDTLGHEAGDHLLQEVAHRLSATLRSSDVVARLGGDEFVLLVQEIDEPEQAATVARKILSATTRPLLLQGQECRVTASIGISMYPGDADDELSLMKNADIAMYQAKEAGKNNYQFYSAQAKDQTLERLALEASLRRALERGEFELHYQAKLDLHSDRITGVEALLRWQHPDLGAVSPAQFIPLAEETGLIVPIGRWVMKTACQQNMLWQRQGLPPVCMAVNLSARQFADDDLLQDITAALQESGMAGELLELELTESMVMQDHQRTIRTLTAVKAMNVRVAIDDFGVGYSSLAQIKNFPIDTLKVDRSFIRDLPENTEDSAITKAIIAMGKTLNLRIVAEGVETVEQESFLRANLCDETQGFYFSRPVPADQFAALLQAHIATPKNR